MGVVRERSQAGLELTRQAQALRNQIALQAEQGAPGEFEFSGAQARQAFALACALDEALHSRNMILIFNPIKEGGYKIHLADKQEHRIDVIRAMVNEKERTGLLVGWYKGLYKAVQRDDGKSAACVFKTFMGPMGIDPFAEDRSELDMFFSYAEDDDHPVHDFIRQAREIAERVFKSGFSLTEETDAKIEIEQADEFLHAIYGMIDSTNSKAIVDNGLFAPQSARRYSG